jgi:hypothetical protein
VGQRLALWMIYGRKETRFETDAVSDRLGERPGYKKYWGHMTAAGKKAEHHVDRDHRYDIAPYALRVDLLDHLVAATVTELTDKPAFRNIAVVQQTRAAGLKSEGTPRFGKDKADNDDDADIEETPLPSRLAPKKRPRTKHMFKDVVIIVEEEGDDDQFVRMSFIDSGAAVGSRLKDVSLEDVELDLLWQFLGKDSFKYWLAWSRRGTDLAIDNDTRLREMIRTQKEIADESREVEELPVYALSLRKGEYLFTRSVMSWSACWCPSALFSTG